MECPHLTVGMGANSSRQARIRDFLKLYPFEGHGLLLLSLAKLERIVHIAWIVACNQGILSCLNVHIGQRSTAIVRNGCLVGILR